MLFFLLDTTNNTRTSDSIGTESLMVIDFTVDVMFLVDILINFRTTYINKKDEVTTVLAPAQCVLAVLCLLRDCVTN